ncbi:hypothetical protein BH23ACT9_BH23ACT9_28330 [soil metagenome]
MHLIVPRLVIMTALLTALLGLPAAAAPAHAPAPASSAGGDAGDLDVYLAPAMVDVEQQVVIHSTFQLHARPGGAPDGAGQSDDRPATPTGDDGEETDVSDDTAVEAPSSGAGAAGARVPSLPQFAQDEDATGTATDGEDAAEDDATDDDATEEDATEEDAEFACDEDDAAEEETTDDTATEEESLFQQDDDLTEDAEVVADEDAANDESEDTETACDAGVVFTVDYGDASPTEAMQITKAAGQDGSRRAIARHTYTAEGSYTVTVTATPDAGDAVVTTVTVQVGGGHARLSGADRVATAVRISQDTFPEDGSASAVLVARGDAFADALASAPLAVLEDAPVLLTTGQELPDAVVQELTRALEPGGRVTILGGPTAVPPAIEDALDALGYVVERVAGQDRVATALAIAESVVAARGDVDEVLLAAADGFADALPAAAHAAANGGIVLLTDGQQLDARVEALLDDLGDVPVTVMGGEAAVSTEVLDALTARGLPVQRVEGDSRYETAVALAEAAETVSDTVVLATGGDFPDALAGAAHAARSGAPVLLVGDSIPEAVRAHLVANAEVIDRIFVLGGDGAVSPAVLDEALAIIGS